ncbi:hypothetical protein RchiOBHm_Chr0c01g0497681 [Rosa chinensis]|uniref:Uncharacterized protein n=1 Tax=Rosa chinensis TaxID=74649 RepID=A0A2P6SQV0_ROSCH|nr:hypothetical protein RchiOBHm_Chr0c01g0497671 [Rosa chinensis]PRQ61058.1 hypothetical protein RchiOBHm_Chr0c01g0497681 [Rosa chinensis]
MGLYPFAEIHNLLRVLGPLCVTFKPCHLLMSSRSFFQCHDTSFFCFPFLVDSRVLFWQGFLFWTRFPG